MTPGAQPDQVASHLLSMARRSQEWVVDLLVEAAESAVRRSAPDSAVAYLTRALEEPPAPERRGQILLDLGISGTNTYAPLALEHLQRGLRAARGSAQARHRGVAPLTHADLRRQPRGRATAFAQRALAELPPELDDERNALEAVELISVYFGADGGGRRRGGRSGGAMSHSATGPARRCSQATVAFGWMIDAGDAEAASELALNAMEGGTLLEADNGVFWMGAMLTLVVADRPETLPLWDADDGPGAPQRLGVLAPVGDACGTAA